jgi:pyruvate dehydrogenase E1 component
MTVLATDGFGCSDTRAALRQRFGVDANGIVQAAQGMMQPSN